MAHPFRTFAQAYVAAVENGAALPSIRQALANLYAAGLALDAEQDSTGWDDSPSVTQQDWRRVYDNLTRSLPKHLYHEVLSDPFQIHDDPKLAIGDLADDLADTWRDMKIGLNAIEEGAAEAAALWHWKLLFDSHWGVHASSALGVLHRFERS